MLQSRWGLLNPLLKSHMMKHAYNSNPGGRCKWLVVETRVSSMTPCLRTSKYSYETCLQGSVLALGPFRRLLQERAPGSHLYNQPSQHTAIHCALSVLDQCGRTWRALHRAWWQEEGHWALAGRAFPKWQTLQGWFPFSPCHSLAGVYLPWLWRKLCSV